ncbi:hypothetical protein ACFQ60_38350 [Streptomyces zhihengii]
MLRSLADCVRQSGRLNAKRHARLLAAVDEAAPEFGEAVDDPARLTWHRWYAARLRADGTDAGDRAAVRAWLDTHARTPRADRVPLPGGLHRADVAARTFAVRALLAELLLAAFARDAHEPGPAGPLLPAPPLAADRPDDALGDALEEIADALTDRWTAEGLSAALAGAHADLAPGPAALPHAALADRMLDEHLDYYGDSAVPLPPPPALPGPGAVRELLHAAPLPAALAAGTFGDDEDLREVSERCGLPGPATAVWTDGTPAELTELAADVLAAQAERMPLVTGPQEAYSFDAAHLLYSLYERGSTPESVARKTADARADGLPPELEDAPAPLSPGAPAAYALPSAGELARLFGVAAVTEADRAALDVPAQGLAALVDQLAATGCVFRTGDAYGLTPLGAAAMRHVLAVGRVAAPDRDTVATWDAAGTVGAARHWPARIGAAALADWAARHGGTDEAWGRLLDAVAAVKTADLSLTRTSDYFARLDLAGVPGTALRAALTDPVTGAAARRVLLARGEQAPRTRSRSPPAPRSSPRNSTSAGSTTCSPTWSAGPPRAAPASPARRTSRPTPCSPSSTPPPRNGPAAPPPSPRPSPTPPPPPRRASWPPSRPTTRTARWRTRPPTPARRPTPPATDPRSRHPPGPHPATVTACPPSYSNSPR